MSCPIKMNTYDADGQMVICTAADHLHCAGCYTEIPRYISTFPYCSQECRKMVEDYAAEVEW